MTIYSPLLMLEGKLLTNAYTNKTTGNTIQPEYNANEHYFYPNFMVRELANAIANAHNHNDDEIVAAIDLNKDVVPNSEDLDNIKCPITAACMHDPVLALDGHTYEREAIETWLNENQRSPITREPMTSDDLVENRIIKDLTDHIVSLRSDQGLRALDRGIGQRTVEDVIRDFKARLVERFATAVALPANAALLSTAGTALCSVGDSQRGSTATTNGSTAAGTAAVSSPLTTVGTAGTATSDGITTTGQSTTLGLQGFWRQENADSDDEEEAAPKADPRQTRS